MPKEAAPDIDFIIADLDLFTRREVVALALNVDANLRESPPTGTPVDTGWARANWVPSLGTASALPATKADPTAADVSARAKDAQEGLNEVLSWKPADGPIFVTNNVPYIAALNEGHSKQSPAGFVQAALEKAVRETYSAARSKGDRLRRASTVAGGSTRLTAFERARKRRAG